MVDLPSSALPLGSYPPGTTRLEAWVGHTIKKKSKRHNERKSSVGPKTKNGFGARGAQNAFKGVALLLVALGPCATARGGRPPVPSQGPQCPPASLRKTACVQAESGPRPEAWPSARCMALGPTRSERVENWRSGAKTQNHAPTALPLLHTPPRLVLSPGALTEEQYGAVRSCLRRGPTPSCGFLNLQRTKAGLGWA